MNPDFQQLAAGDHVRSLHVDGRDRSYLVHVPSGYDAIRAWPVVLAFHGAGTNAESMVEFCGLSEKADAAGFVAVYPNGTGRRDDMRTWNAGNCCGYAHFHQVDDVRFVAALLDDLATLLPLDPARIYAAGMSNGAMLAYRLACELSGRIAAIAAIGGPMAIEPCVPARPVSVIHFHGTEDEFAPFAGGVGQKSMYRVPKDGIEQTVTSWAQRNGCSPEPRISVWSDQADDGTTITVRSYGPGRDDSEVVLYVIAGGGHTWPGRQPRLTYLGRSTHNLVTNDLLWDFFTRHRMRGEA